MHEDAFTSELVLAGHVPGAWGMRAAAGLERAHAGQAANGLVSPAGAWRFLRRADSWVLQRRRTGCNYSSRRPLCELQPGSLGECSAVRHGFFGLCFAVGEQ